MTEVKEFLLSIEWPGALIVVVAIAGLAYVIGKVASR